MFRTLVTSTVYPAPCSVAERGRELSGLGKVGEPRGRQLRRIAAAAAVEAERAHLADGKQIVLAVDDYRALRRPGDELQRIVAHGARYDDFTTVADHAWHAGIGRLAAERSLHEHFVRRPSPPEWPLGCSARELHSRRANALVVWTALVQADR